MDVYLARQPIFTKDVKIHAYELLFRESMTNLFPDIDGDHATSRVLTSTFFTSGLGQITGGKRAFVNFTPHLIRRRIPLLFPYLTTTVEVLETVEPDPDIIACLDELTAKGYSIALDDFAYQPRFEPLIQMADIIKIDFRAGTKDVIKDYVRQIEPHGIKLLAEKVETNEEFQAAITMGFTYFQGYFFSRPQVMVQKDIPSLKMNLIQIMSEANSENYQVPEMKKLIERDVGISYKLLRYMNSPYFRRMNEISSIRHAIVMLGENGLRQFLSVIILAELSSDKPDEIIKTSIIRAKVCESLALLGTRKLDSSELFTLGLFSLIDAILDTDMDNIMKKLPLTEEIKSALLGKEGMLSDYLCLAVCYEKGDWDLALQLASRYGIPEEALPVCYLEAIGWADALFKSNSTPH